MDVVFIRGLEVRTLIGVSGWEREVRQPVVLNLEMATDVRAAAATDSIDDALNYATISERLRTSSRAAEFSSSRHSPNRSPGFYH